MNIYKLFDKIVKPLYGSGIGNYFPFNLCYKIYVNFLISKGSSIIDINLGKVFFKIKVNPAYGSVDRDIYINKKFEKEITNLFLKKLKKDHRFIDVGSNIGYYSLLASKIVGTKGKVFSFEPLKKSFQILKENIDLNKLNNIQIYNKGCGNKNDFLYICYDIFNLGHSSVIEGRKFKNYSNKEKIEIIKLDNFITEKIDLIKVDVEGYEFNVLKGAKKILLNYSPKLIFEFSPEIYKNITEDYVNYSKNFLNYLINLNYNIYEINKDNLKLIENIDKFIEELKDNQTNLFCEK